ncbi:sugar O-acetyltransferase [Trueperella pecoris]|uniref:Sugar O-acetyltransferase n=2 Tax=Trueperella pecoris TaxID=2733571 RepID=A0A7M1QXT9_9ACTO|nr:sugar O-acetyltransferase [Trueperella pecoris]QOR46666.1 sugar O-acetyltransferase [Trueperella pecoris]
MRSGRLYRVEGEVFSEAFARSMSIQDQMNALPSADIEVIAGMARQLFGTFGEGAAIRTPVYCDYGSHTHIGEGTFINFDCVFLDVADIVIGNNCQIAPRVQFLTAEHPLAATPRREGWESGRPIRVGDNVWLGAGVLVLPGVTIGDNTVVGAGSIVDKDLPANVVAVGNPARVLRPLPGDADPAELIPKHLL